MLRELRSKWSLRRDESSGAGMLLLGLALAVALAYGSVVDNGLYEIDDPILLGAISRGVSSTPHFRPLFWLWNTLLYRLFGLTIWPYYVAGLAIHAASAWACALLVQRSTSSKSAAAVAGLVFALFYSPHQVVLWISANCGLLAVGFALLAAVSWHRYASTDSRRAALLAWFAAAGSMASKEECVVLAPLLLGIDGCVNGARAFRPRRFVRRYAAIALLAAVYLSIAFRPGLWSDRESVGKYAFGPELLPKLLGNFGMLFAVGQRHPAETSPIAVLLGAVLAAALAAAAARLRAQRRLILAGLAIALFGMAPALPGPFPIAGSRYAYPAIIGVALTAGALAAAFETWTAPRRTRLPWRAAAAIALALWLGIQVAAIRSIESWLYASGGERFRALIEGTRTAVSSLRSEASSPGRLAVIAPDIWNPADYESGVRLYLGRSVVPSGVEWIRPTADAAAFTGAPLFASFGDGRLARLDPRELRSALARLSKIRVPYAGDHAGELPVVWLSIERPPSGG